MGHAPGTPEQALRRLRSIADRVTSAEVERDSWITEALARGASVRDVAEAARLPKSTLHRRFAVAPEVDEHAAV